MARMNSAPDLRAARKGSGNRLIVLSPAFPYPAQSGGDIRLFELLKRLSSKFELHLVSYGSGDAETFMRNSGVKSVRLVSGGQAPNRFNRRFRRIDLWRGAPHGMRLDVDPAFAEAVRETIGRAKPDGLLIEHAYMAQYRALAPQLPVFASCYDIETVKMKRWFVGKKPSLRVVLRSGMQTRAMARNEARLGDSARTVFTTSDVDADVLRNMNPRGRYVTVRNGIDPQYFTARSRESFDGPPAAFFIGTLFYQPNLDAALRIQNNIWPLVRAQVPDAVCHIVGNHGGEDLRRHFSEGSGMAFHGLVPDIRPYQKKCQAMLVPLSVGSGTRIKILECMAAATPVVSTTIGAEGIAYADGRDILIADTDEALAQRVVELFRDRNVAYRMGAAGRELVVSSYTWDESARIMSREMMTALGDAGEGRRVA